MTLLHVYQFVAVLAFLLFVFFFQDIPFSLLWFSLLLALNIGLFILRKKKSQHR
ncbi:hypothetical protein [Shouchella hunanensis]|uniref:Uncharacterized protein n=1 Tax=Shouchella hunanensis TaxID=766894 RepID=A0ABY7W4Z3_9BACI|nr:hypothetical protein [Shouchella hunanensis]WDF04025.1 hypothetical protein PQ477_00690 [Shouchella hunanensis]